LRRYDFLQNEAAQVNDIIDFLSNHITIFKKDYALLLSALDNMSGSPIENKEYHNILETLKKQADICNKHLSVFKIDDINDR
jgi:hypothetical protein